MEKQKIFLRGSVHHAKLGQHDPTKFDLAIKHELGKIRPVVILTTQKVLDLVPSIVFVCPLSSQRESTLSALHEYRFEMEARDKLKVKSYAVVEHCRAIAVNRIVKTKLTQATEEELEGIITNFKRLIDG
jgi:mRNA interferase MazF